MTATNDTGNLNTDLNSVASLLGFTDLNAEELARIDGGQGQSDLPVQANTVSASYGYGHSSYGYGGYRGYYGGYRGYYGGYRR
jgi:hypothetical protein